MATRRTVGAVAVVVVLAVVNTLWVGIGAAVEASCSTNGFGTAHCAFTNRGALPGTRCVSATVIATDQVARMQSHPICSGVVWPQSSVTIDMPSAYDHQPSEWCLAGHDGRRRPDKWTDVCAVVAERP